MVMQFEWVLIAIFCWIMWSHYTKYRTEAFLPSILTTWGILGTFIGIAYGLWQFKSSNIAASVPNMIGGLKICCLCSAFGMFLAILAKKEYNQHQKYLQTENQLTINTIETLLGKLVETSKAHNSGLELLSSQLAVIPIEAQTIREQLDNQTEKVLKVVEFNHNEHLRVFNIFTEKVVTSSTDALVQSLKQVVKDFNHKVTSQFGENFTIFNDALEKLLRWQDNYYKDITEMQNQFDRCLKGIETSENALTSLGKEAGTLVEIAQNLKALMEACEESRKFLSDNLETFSSLASRAKEAFPIIQDNITQLTTELKDHISTSVSQLDKAVIEQQKAFSGITANFSKLEENATAHSDLLFRSLNNRLTEHNELITQQIEISIMNLSKQLTEQAGKLDKALEQELTKSLNSLGDKLAQLSCQFTKDYTPLTEKLREIVMISQNLKNTAT